MVDTMPVPANERETLALLAVDTAVLLDGYRDSAVVAALAQESNIVVAANPHLHPPCVTRGSLLNYVRTTLALSERDSNVLFMNRCGTEVYEHFYGMHFGLVVVDPDPDDPNPHTHIERAIDLHPTVVVIDRINAWPSSRFASRFDLGEQYQVAANGMLRIVVNLAKTVRERVSE